MTLLINDLLFSIIRRPRENMWTCLRWFVLSTVTTNLERSPKETIVVQWLRRWWKWDDQQLPKPKSPEHVDPIEELFLVIPADPGDLADSTSSAPRLNKRKRFDHGDQLMDDITANHIVRNSETARYVVMKRPPAPGAGSNPGRRGFER